MTFETEYSKILEKINEIDPFEYGESRNYINGAVTYLSPYISRGVISTHQIYQACIQKNIAPVSIDKFIQELAWRDYWQQTWTEKQSKIDSDFKNKQTDVENYLISDAFLNCTTGILAIDEALKGFYENGYLHNHLRMYIASMSTNIAKSHWCTPAKWMYYHLLDADWASNALSWQWVCGANSKKKYYANQENIDKYCKTNQWNSYLDLPYEALPNMEIPNELQTLSPFELKTILPKQQSLHFNNNLPTFLYTWYNLDPLWRQEMKGNRILILEPSHFEKYPISDKSVDFMMALANNIPGIQVYTGEFQEFFMDFEPDNIYFKEHPTNVHFQGVKDERDWLTSVKGYYPSFFSFWKKARKELTGK
jgi:deoxyribodipyrimidine photo-lyase